MVMYIHEHYYSVHGLGTSVHVRNFGVQKRAAYVTCTQTYFYQHEKTRTQVFTFSSPDN